MKILHIDETFHPLYGYHTAPLIREQAKTNEVYIITVSEKQLYPVYKEFGDEIYDLNNDIIYEKETGAKIYRLKIKGYISGRAIYKKNVFKLIDEINPDIIYCHLVESYIAIRLILKNKKYKIVFDSHMLSMATKNKFSKIYNFVYRLIVTPKIKKNNYTVIRMQDDSYVNEYLKIPTTNTPFISFGTDTYLFKENLDIKKKIKLSFLKIIIYTLNLLPTIHFQAMIAEC